MLPFGILDIVLVLGLCVTRCHQAQAIEFTVACDGSGTHTTIQGALVAVSNLSTVLLYIKLNVDTYDGDKSGIIVPQSKTNIYLIGEGIYQQHEQRWFQ